MDIRNKNYHVMSPKRLRMTVAVDVPAKQDLIQMMNEHFGEGMNAKFMGKLGIALVHPNDQYIKKLGALTAQQNLAPSLYTFLAVERKGPETIFKFAVTNAEMQKSNPRFTVVDGFIEVNYAIHHDSNAVHISFVNIVKIQRKF